MPRSTTPRSLLAVLGPGLLAANAGNDAGGIATYASAGAQFSYRMLFLLLPLTVGVVVVQEMSARLGAHGGEGIVALVRDRCSARAAHLLVACLLVANLGLVVSEFAGIGAASELLGVSRFVSVPFFAVVLWALVALGSYTWAERGLLLLSASFAVYVVAAVAVRPDWNTVVTDTVRPHLAANRAFLVLAVALVGTTITPSMQVFQAAAVVDRGIGPAGYRRARVDTVTGAVVAGVVSMCIIVATAATIGGSGPLPGVADAARALGPVAGPGATALFAVGLLGASALAAAVVPLSTAYAMAEGARAERSVSCRFREAPLFLGVFTALVIVGAAAALVPIDLIGLLVGTQVVNGIMAPVMLGFVLVLANDRVVLGDAVNSRRTNAIAGACVLGISLLAGAVVVLGLAGPLG